VPHYFAKYSGLGNDFILVHADDWVPEDAQHSWSQLASELCSRRMGIGADGLIIFHPRAGGFSMTVVNADGSFATMCGNAARCAAEHFFSGQPGALTKVPFEYVQILGSSACSLPCTCERKRGSIEIDYTVERQVGGPFHINGMDWHYVNSGTDHVVAFVDSQQDLDTLDACVLGRSIRNHESFQPHGTNVNVVYCADPFHFFLRTYERGVEDETLACATGSLAAAIAYMVQRGLRHHSATVVQRSGGELRVACEEHGSHNLRVTQEGEVRFICRGEYEEQHCR